MAGNVSFKTNTPVMANTSREIGEMAKRYENLSNQFLNATNDVANDWVGNVSDKYIQSIQSLSTDLKRIVDYLNEVSSKMMEQKNNYVKANEEVDGVIPNRK